MSKQHRVTSSKKVNAACADRQLMLPLDAKLISMASGPSARVYTFPKQASTASKEEALRKILDFADSLA